MALVYCCSLDGLIASIVLLICTSLWIKASAKWLNVNVNWLMTTALTIFNVTVQVSVALVLLRTVKIGIFSLAVHQGRHLESSFSSASTGIESNDLWLRWPSGNFHEVIGILSMIFPKKFTAEEIWTISQQHWTSQTKNWDVLQNVFICVAQIKKKIIPGLEWQRWVNNDRFSFRAELSL